MKNINPLSASDQEAQSGPATGETGAEPNSHENTETSQAAPTSMPQSTSASKVETPAPKMNLAQLHDLFVQQQTAVTEEITDHRKAIIDTLIQYKDWVGKDHYARGIVALLKHYPEGLTLNILREVFGDADELNKARKKLVKDRVIIEAEEGQTVRLRLVKPE